MIELDDVHYAIGQFTLQGIRLEIAEGQYAVLMGPTGQGKTTLLEIICGLRAIRRGRVLIRGVDVTSLAPAEREVGYVPQDLALFPHLTAREHLEFALRLRRYGRGVIQRRVDELAELLGITHLLRRRPEGMSGGERQRIALGRAVAFWPSVLLLDEPLSALDLETRQAMQGLLRSLRERTAMTTLHVTHDAAEARALADRLFVLSQGSVAAAVETH